MRSHHPFRATTAPLNRRLEEVIRHHPPTHGTSDSAYIMSLNRVTPPTRVFSVTTLTRVTQLSALPVNHFREHFNLRDTDPPIIPRQGEPLRPDD